MLSVSLPIALSGLTTTVGFVAMGLVRIEAVRSTGLYGAIGVLGVSLVTLTLIPAVLAISRRRWPSPAFFKKSEAIASWITQTAQQKRRMILLLWAILGVIAFWGLEQVKVETDATRWLPRRRPTHRLARQWPLTS